MVNSLAEFAGVGPLLAVAFVAAVMFAVVVVGGAVAARVFSPPEREHSSRQYLD